MGAERLSRPGRGRGASAATGWERSAEADPREIEKCGPPPGWPALFSPQSVGGNCSRIHIQQAPEGGRQRLPVCGPFIIERCPFSILSIRADSGIRKTYRGTVAKVTRAGNPWRIPPIVV